MNNPKNRGSRKGDSTVETTAVLQVKASHDEKTGVTVLGGDVQLAPGNCCPSCGQAMPAIATAPDLPVGPTKYRVSQGGTFSQNGSLARVVDDQVISVAAYGKDGIDRMLRRGIVLEPLD